MCGVMRAINSLIIQISYSHGEVEEARECNSEMATHKQLIFTQTFHYSKVLIIFHHIISLHRTKNMPNPLLFCLRHLFNIKRRG